MDDAVALVVGKENCVTLLIAHLSATVMVTASLQGFATVQSHIMAVLVRRFVVHLSDLENATIAEIVLMGGACVKVVGLEKLAMKLSVPTIVMIMVAAHFQAFALVKKVVMDQCVSFLCVQITVPVMVSVTITMRLVNVSRVTLVRFAIKLHVQRAVLKEKDNV